MRLTPLRKFADSLLARRGLMLAGANTFGLSIASDLGIFWRKLKLSPVQNIIDIGANYGDQSRAFMKAFPSAKVISVEPNPRLCGILHSISDLVVVESAVGAQNGQLPLILYKNSSPGDRAELSTLVHGGSFAELHGIPRSHSLLVDVITLDELATRYSLGHVDIVKIDVEGGEFAVLEGGANLFEQQSIGCVVIEWSAREGKRTCQVTLMDIVKHMGNYNYVLLGSSVNWVKSRPLYCNNNAYFFSSSLLHS